MAETRIPLKMALLMGKVSAEDADTLLDEHDAHVLREAAAAINAMPPDYECDPGRGDAVQLLNLMADASNEKSTPDGSPPAEGDATPAAPTGLLAHATVFEIPWAGSILPLQVRRSTEGGDRWAICDRQGRRWDRQSGFVYERQDLDERTRTDTRFPLADAWPLAHQIAAGDHSAHATDPDGASQ
ncbi:hypothetical protein [Streptomyces cylindrosporus]|uniref:Uncharacterized protein n=1 Tax=Streptomyces cylindrosporus TaxID=2927583 RepID=A0ABS9YKS0_9ACTN|nr:hypothetical protein [Streptomyces cylindrosporus]MCI3277499.1 hypothetical protein [Streptomyces cylindrosporus]